MCRLSQAQLDDALAAIDAANADDPSIVVVRGGTWPLAQIHGRLADEWIQQLHPQAPDTWRIAARAHHLRRWEMPRSTFPEGRAGYHRWKRAQRVRHATDVAKILASHGFDDAAITDVQAMVRRDDLATNPGTQAVEDAACLVFIETQLVGVAERLDRGHMIEVIRKTARKMSPSALAATSAISLDPISASLLAAALASPSD